MTHPAAHNTLLAGLALSLFACGAQAPGEQPGIVIDHPNEEAQAAMPGARASQRSAGLAGEIHQDVLDHVAQASAQNPPQRFVNVEALKSVLEEVTGQPFALTGTHAGRTLLESPDHILVVAPEEGRLHLHTLGGAQPRENLKIEPEDLEIAAGRVLDTLGIDPREHAGPGTTLRDDLQNDGSPIGARIRFERQRDGEPVAGGHVSFEFTATGALLSIEGYWPALQQATARRAHVGHAGPVRTAVEHARTLSNAAPQLSGAPGPRPCFRDAAGTSHAAALTGHLRTNLPL